MPIGDEPLAPAAVAAPARGGPLTAILAPAARERMAAGHATAVAVATRREVYGRTTGVGANRDVSVHGDLRAHTVRLLRSHAGGLGDPLPDDVVRATLLVRLAQMAPGAGGSRPEVADALAALLGEATLPTLRDLGGIGTGDLTVLAQLGLALAAERRLVIEPGDALPLMSSNAATFAVADAGRADMRDLLDAALGVAALTFHALRGNGEAFAEPLAAARPLSGLAAVSARMRALILGGAPAVRLQDPFGLRCRPPVAGALPRGAGDAPRGPRGGDQRRRGEPLLRGRAGAPPRRLPRRPVRAGAGRRAARGRLLRRPLHRPALPPHGARA